jgi:CDGSH-type Zn-finger protein
MTPMIKNFAKCGCGRSESGFCDGSHALTVEEYTVKLMSRTSEYTIFPETDSEKPIPYAPT